MFLHSKTRYNMEDTTNLLNVLWVEDNESLFQSFSMEAKRSPYYLKLIPNNCWVEAKKVLLEQYDDISAIILDAKCKYRKDDPDDTLNFLPNVLKELGEIAILKKRTIPWFILSAGDGGDSGEVGRLDWTKRGRLEWDDWEGDFYKKGTDRPTLYTRIREFADVSNEIQIKTILYKPVFEALNSLQGFDNREAKKCLTDVLVALHFPLDNMDFKASLYYNQLRKVLECLFRTCNKVGLVPDQCISNGVVNLNQSSKYLAGKEADKTGVRYVGEDGRIAPEHIEKEIRSILELGNINSHTLELDEDDKLKLDRFFRTANSKYIVFSLALQLCDVVVWLKDYISNHNNKEDNLRKCQLLPKDDPGDVGIELESARKKYEGNKYMPNRDKDGDWYCGECFVILKDTHKGIITIEQVVENNNPRTKGKYKFFAKYKHE